MARTREEILAKYKPQAIAQGPVESQKLRTVAQGASFGIRQQTLAKLLPCKLPGLLSHLF
jgi:hypothetical protein